MQKVKSRRVKIFSRPVSCCLTENYGRLIASVSDRVLTLDAGSVDAFCFQAITGTSLRTMNLALRPWHLLSFVLAGWINRNQQAAIEYLLAENRVLREKLGRRRILLNDDQRRRLAAKARLLGRKRLAQLATIATPDTILR